GAYVRLRRNDMTPITEAINDQLVRRWVNLGNPFAYGVEMSVGYSPSDNYQLQVNLNAGGETIADVPSEIFLQRSHAQFANFSLRQNITAWQQLKIDLNWRGNFIREGFFSERYFTHIFDLAFRHNLWQNRLQLSLRGEDILYSEIWRGRWFGPDFTAHYYWRERGPTIFIGFNYRFENGAATRKRDRKQRKYGS
ncbi:MAG: outer membrane beta-barrel protein, partial [Bacteroidota bacterium]